VRAPDIATTATLDELVAAVVDALKPWRGSQTETTAAVREQITLLRAVMPEHFTRDAIRRTRDDARDLIKTINKLERQLTRIKRSSPELRIRLGLSEPLPWFFADLYWLREQCKTADKVAGKEDRSKRLCVDTAALLIQAYSTKTLTVDRTGEIASLLFQAATGLKPSKTDFRRLCQATVQRWKSKKI